MRETFDHLKKEHLQKRQRLSKIAIMIAIIGAFTAFGASFYRYNISEAIPITTFAFAILCLITMIPVVFQLKTISTLLGRK